MVLVAVFVIDVAADVIVLKVVVVMMVVKNKVEYVLSTFDCIIDYTSTKRMLKWMNIVTTCNSDREVARFSQPKADISP